MNASSSSPQVGVESPKAKSLTLLQVRNLTVCISIDSTHAFYPVNDVTFQVRTGEVVGLLGESGAGKTTLALALLRLLPSSSRIVNGSIDFEGRPVLSLSGRELRKIRGARFSVIYQDSTVLNPVIRIGNQLVEILRAHYDWSLKQCREKAIALLEDVELQSAGRVFASFPHQLSGGQRQRVVIAQALACRPVFVIADEPTASLDSATAGEILDLLGRLKKSYLTSFLLISHDLIPLEYLADRIMVMYAGRIVEQGPAAQVMQNPLHPYTQALLACDLSRMPANPESVARIPMQTIPGDPPDLTLAVSGCRFGCRCQSRMSVCRGLFPKEVEPAADHTVQCFMFGG